MSALLLALLTSSSAMAQVPHGADLDDAIAVDLTAAGFVELPRVVGNLIPSNIPVPPVELGDRRVDCIIPNPFGGCWVDVVTYDYFVRIDNVDVNIQLINLTMTPADQVIELDATARIKINNQQAPATIAAGVEIVELIDIDTNCGFWLNPVDVDIFTTIEIDIVDDLDGQGVVDATVSPILWEWNLEADDLQLSECGLADIQDFFDGALFDLINFNPWELAIGAILDTVEDSIDEPIQELAVAIEPALEDAFAAVEISEEIPLGESILYVEVWPEDIDIQPEGMRIQLGSSISADIHPCMDAYMPNGSLSTAGELPTLGSAPLDVREGHHVGILVDDDLINQALYSVWAGGLLCFTLEDGDDSLPVAINTSLLTIVAGDAFEGYFPETESMEIITRPTVQPYAVLDGAHDITARIEGLGLDMYANLDGRMARMIGAQIETDAGVDLGWVTTTGELSLDITFDAEDIEPTVTYLELAPGSETQVEDQLSGLMGTIVDPLVGDLLTDIRFGMPTLEGLGLTTLEYAASGDGGDHIGVYSELGLVQYDNGGCDGEGCADTGSSCGGGCAVGGATAPARAVYGALFLLFMARRRRNG